MNKRSKIEKQAFEIVLIPLRLRYVGKEVYVGMQVVSVGRYVGCEVALEDVNDYGEFTYSNLLLYLLNRLR